MPTENQCITVANDDTICELICSASNRLVVLAPALHEKVAQALVAQWAKLGADRVSVILDLDAEVFRLGYGELSALQLLEQTATRLGTMVQRQPGIRIGVVVADNVTLIYSPTPLLIEAGPAKLDPSKPRTPNAIRLNHTPQAIAAEVGHGEEGCKSQTIGLDKAKAADVVKLEQDLKENPPQPFDISRKVRVFNAAFEFVDFELSGTTINQMTVAIPKHLYGIADEQTRDQLRTSCSLVPPGHKLSGDCLRQDRNLIAKKYLRTIPGFGAVVLRSHKADFVADVEKLQDAVEAFGVKVRMELQAAMDKSRENLVKSMLPLVKRTPPREWLKSNEKKLDPQTARQFLDDDLRRAFGSADRLVKHMKVSLVFKGVTFELLTNPEFREAAKKAIPELQKLYEDFDAAKAVRKQDAQ